MINQNDLILENISSVIQVTSAIAGKDDQRELI